MNEVVGALAVAFAFGVGWWWVAHHMDWWAYGLTVTGWAFLVALVRIAVKDLAK